MLTVLSPTFALSFKKIWLIKNILKHEEFSFLMICVELIYEKQQINLPVSSMFTNDKAHPVLIIVLVLLLGKGIAIENPVVTEC